MTPKDLKRMLGELKRGLQNLYGQQLIALLLFGSYARGEQDAESDLDVLIILDDFSLYSNEIKRTSELISKLSLKFGVPISRKFLRESTWQTDDTPLIRNARAEAILT
jgi:predicted nucleotidyltransferase